MKAEDIKSWSELVSAWVTTVALIAGGCFGLVEYAHKNRSEEIKATLDFLDRYDKPPYLEARQHVFALWHANEYMDGVRIEAAKKNDDELAAMLLKNVAEHKFAVDIDRLVEFYDALDACTCGRACEAEAVMRLFHRQASDINANAFPYILEQRRKFNDAHIGVALHAIALAKSEDDLMSRCEKG